MKKILEFIGTTIIFSTIILLIWAVFCAIIISIGAFMTFDLSIYSGVLNLLTWQDIRINITVCAILGFLATVNMYSEL